VRELFDLGSVTRHYESLYDGLLGMPPVQEYPPLAIPSPACSRSAN
jgi:hypothetical protein